MNELNVTEQPDEDSEYTIGQAAVARYYHQLGEGVERLTLMMATEAKRGRFVYNMQIRWPTKDNPGFLTIIKALHPDGPQIAFHGADQLPGALTGAAARHRAGSLEWRQDDYPPDGWEEALAFRHSNQNYRG